MMTMFALYFNLCHQDMLFAKNDEKTWQKFGRIK